ncbi:MAG: phosphatase [Spirochaetae bacterium HGW-Spirochaetae-2]|jgi:putative hydrolase|nr:MAG: phosphatase [Spirochaetae bacterium HGW-Spirochaetae-2]
MNEKTYCIIGDFHTHTMVSQHAYSTIQELVDASRRQGFQAIAITDHGPEMLDGAIAHHFLCMDSLPPEVDGIRLYKGAEVNIKNFSGRIDLPDNILKTLDFTIASFHIEAITPGTVEENTAAWLAVVRNPYVDCMGHAGNPLYPFHHEEVIREVKRQGKTLEINANSFLVRKGSEKNCAHLIELCKHFGVPVMVNSDAHNAWTIGEVAPALTLLEHLDFPPSMILNHTLEGISSFIQRRKDEKQLMHPQTSAGIVSL